MNSNNPEDHPAGTPQLDTEAAEELAWFRQAQQGDFTAFQRLVQRWQDRVFHLAFRILGQRQDAEDVTQQTFLSVIEHLEQFRGDSSVRTWVLRIATNHALQLLRRKRAQAALSLDSLMNDAEDRTPLPHPEYIARWRQDPHRLAQDHEVRQLIEQALNELDDKYRLVFVLRDIEGLSVRETADILGISESNVKVRLLRARLQLRERLTASLGDSATRVFPDHSHHPGHHQDQTPPSAEPPQRVSSAVPHPSD
jgi:RNA polymerase sigma-70 factor (ECF subfamily)